MGGKVLKLLIDWGITLEQSGFKLVWISFFLFFFVREYIARVCQRPSSSDLYSTLQLFYLSKWDLFPPLSSFISWVNSSVIFNTLPSYCIVSKFSLIKSWKIPGLLSLVLFHITLWLVWNLLCFISQSDAELEPIMSWTLTLSKVSGHLQWFLSPGVVFVSFWLFFPYLIGHWITIIIIVNWRVLMKSLRVY